MFGSALAHAQSAHWTFTYTGFYDQEAGAFLPDMQIAGSFTGFDQNADGVLEIGELSSLTIGSMDYVACAASSNAWYHCGADSFVFSPNSGLSFSLGEYGGDPEGWNSGGHLIETGKLSYDYRITPYNTVEHHLLWNEKTVLSMVSASAVPPVAGGLSTSCRALPDPTPRAGGGPKEKYALIAKLGFPPALE